MFKFIYFFMIVVAGTAGELCVSRAMKETGEVKDFRPAAVAGDPSPRRVKWTGMASGRRRWSSSRCWLFVDRESQLRGSGTAPSGRRRCTGGDVFPRERISLRRWTGIVLVCIGVTLVFLGKG